MFVLSFSGCTITFQGNTFDSPLVVVPVDGKIGTINIIADNCLPVETFSYLHCNGTWTKISDARLVFYSQYDSSLNVLDIFVSSSSSQLITGIIYFIKYPTF